MYTCTINVVNIIKFTTFKLFWMSRGYIYWLSNWGAVVIKFWLQIDEDEQL